VDKSNPDADARKKHQGCETLDEFVVAVATRREFLVRLEKRSIRLRKE
jgi:hypothetical protein